MSGRASRVLVRGLVLCLLFLAACAPAMAPTPAPAVEKVTNAPAEEATQAQEPAAVPTQAAPEATRLPEATATPVTEARVVEMEWPERLRMGESDVIRLALIPVKDGYVAQAEFPDHTLQTKEIPVPRPNGYTLYAVARLDGVGFDITPSGDQERFVPVDEEIAWRWTLAPRAPGQQRLAVQLRLRWTPASGTVGAERESLAYARGLDVQVSSFLGMTAGQATSTGLIGLLVGMSMFGIAFIGRALPQQRSGRHPPKVQVGAPNPALRIEAGAGIVLSSEENGLLRSLFSGYSRAVLEHEFFSGYSGARTFLVRPVRPDDCADALTIVKLGPRLSIENEFDNYEAFVKDRLPPVTARIQRAPVVLTSRKTPTQRAAMQYTFIAEPGRAPVSLRRTLLDSADADLILRLFDTFGPNWWMQRRPYTFRLGQEYDCLLPPHYVLEPLDGACARALLPGVGENDDPGRLDLVVDDIVFVRPFHSWETRVDGITLSLAGKPGEGRPALRLRWLNTTPPNDTPARVTATRMDLLRGWVRGFDSFGLPDPLGGLPALLEETIAGTRSVIHGDLNLENVLVGPGSLVWLIDFAQTREGHPLFDFAHLESELIAHVLAPRLGSPKAFLDLLLSGSDPLLNAVRAAASRCLFDPARPREYQLALGLACLGALKYQNLDELARHCLWLAGCAALERSGA